MALLSAVIQRGTRASQPAATAVGAGTLYCVSDEGNIVERSTGAVWQAYSPTSATAAIEVTLDGGGSALTTGVKLDLEVPWNMTITAATLLADQSGSVVVDVWKDSYANYPPTNADSICASAKPTISTATKSQDTTLTGWTTTLTEGQTLRFNVDSCTTITRVTLSLKGTRT